MMTPVTNYAPFNEDYVQENFVSDVSDFLSSRTFQDIRIDREIQHGDKDIDYNALFNKIHGKLFKNEENLDCPLEDEYKKYVDMYYQLKKEMCDIFLEYNSCEKKYEENDKKFKSFCESIKNSIFLIQQIGLGDSDDKMLIDILSKKIDQYHSLLEIDKLESDFKFISNKYSAIKKNVYHIRETFFKDAATCSICTTDMVEYFIDPCGHTICGSCKDKCTSSTCHYCRTKRKAFRKLFY